jgi:hypothetical protein
MRTKLLTVFMFFLVCGCAGTINTVRHSNQDLANFKKAYIVSAENSQYIRFKFGAITPYGYIILPDRPPTEHTVVGDTDVVIKKELEKYGISAVIGKRGDIPVDLDLIVEYYDTWRWDFGNILDRLEIVFISPEGDKEIARSIYKIYWNKEMHDFPTPEKEVPKMIKELLGTR